MINITCLMLDPKYGSIIAYYKIWSQKTNIKKEINHSYYYSKDVCVKRSIKAWGGFMNHMVIHITELRARNDISATGGLCLWLPGISLLQLYFYLVVFPGLIFNIYWNRLLFLTALQREKSSRVLWFAKYFAQAAL